MAKFCLEMYSNYPSLLSRDESGAIKGLLILLIVLGHNSLIMNATGLFPFLYSFHVYCFYILPFIYGFNQGNSKITPVKNVLKRAIHSYSQLYPLYLIWCCIGIMLGFLLKHQEFNMQKIFFAIISGNQPYLATYCGFAFLWFLPTILAVMIWRDIYFLLPSVGKFLIFFISLSLWGFSVAGITNFHKAGIYVPFALIQGLFFSASGIAARKILVHCKCSRKTRLAAIILLFVIPAFLLIRNRLPWGSIWLSWLIPPVIAFICIFQYKDFLGKNSFLKFIGKYSLQIYLLHVPIFNILQRIDPWKSLITGIIIYIITIVCCFEITKLVEKSPFKWIIFTRRK